MSDSEATNFLVFVKHQVLNNLNNLHSIRNLLCEPAMWAAYSKGLEEVICSEPLEYQECKRPKHVCTANTGNDISGGGGVGWQRVALFFPPAVRANQS